MHKRNIEKLKTGEIQEVQISTKIDLETRKKLRVTAALMDKPIGTVSALAIKLGIELLHQNLEETK